MVSVHINEAISEKIPTFKMGVVQYYNIVIGDSPQMLKGRLQFFQETLKVDLEAKELSEYAGITEWRQLFKTVQTNPKRYPPSHEALYTRIKKRGMLPSVHSAVDLNNLFSLQYTIPFGIYDLAKIEGDIVIRIGSEHDQYDGVNGRVNTMNQKIISADQKGAFGSPYVDSLRTIVTTNTTKALHLIYLCPSMNIADAEKLTKTVGTMFTQVHGGDFKSFIATSQ